MFVAYLLSRNIKLSSNVVNVTGVEVIATTNHNLIDKNVTNKYLITLFILYSLNERLMNSTYEILPSMFSSNTEKI